MISFYVNDEGGENPDGENPDSLFQPQENAESDWKRFQYSDRVLLERVGVLE